MTIALIIKGHFIAKNSFTVEVIFKNRSRVKKKKKKKKKKEKAKNNRERQITPV